MRTVVATTRKFGQRRGRHVFGREPDDSLGVAEFGAVFERVQGV